MPAADFPAKSLSLLRQDIITGDEILSDSYDLKDVDGIVYEADCAMITEGAVEVSTYLSSVARSAISMGFDPVG